MKSDEELIAEFEKDEGIYIQEAEMFGNYKHKIEFGVELNKYSEIDEEYIHSIDNVKLKNHILVSKLDKDGNRVNNKGDIISNNENCKPSEAKASQWLRAKGVGEGRHNHENCCDTYVGKWMIFVPMDQLDLCGKK